MPEPLTTATAGARVVTPSSAPAARAAGSDLNKDDFLKLLLAQLRNQDPMKPMEDREFIAQMAQFRALEATQQLHGLVEQSLELQLMGQASALVGKHVQASYADGSHVAGAVSAVRFATEGGRLTPKLQVGPYELDLADVGVISADGSS